MILKFLLVPVPSPLRLERNLRADHLHLLVGQLPVAVSVHLLDDLINLFHRHVLLSQLQLALRDHPVIVLIHDLEKLVRENGCVTEIVD